jgi:hypothetical protein
MAKPMSIEEIEALARGIRNLLADPDSNLNEGRRRRWEGALTALEAVLGLDPSLVDDFDLGLL